jgi:hypothetical protein
MQGIWAACDGHHACGAVTQTPETGSPKALTGPGFAPHGHPMNPASNRFFGICREIIAA